MFDALFIQDAGDERLWMFTINSMKAGADEDLQTIAQSSIEKLTLVSPQPFLTEHMDGILDLSFDIPVCVYTSAENDEITAFSRYIDLSDHDGDDEDREEIKKQLMTKVTQNMRK